MRATEHCPPQPRLIAAGDGWTIYDVVCTAGPSHPAFEEEHSAASVAVVVSGTFQYRTPAGRALMAPGSLLLGNPRESFMCAHQHGVGDRCISFHYSDEFREQAGLDHARHQFCVPRIPAVRCLSPLVATALMLLRNETDHAACEEIAFQVLDRATRFQHGFEVLQRKTAPGSLARVTRVLRTIEANPGAPHRLSHLSAEARLSPFHFLRCFEEFTGATPRQYLLRTRLRRAAIRLKDESTRIIDIALDSGFGDVSNFNRAFRAEFGRSPREYRRG